MWKIPRLQVLTMSKWSIHEHHQFQRVHVTVKIKGGTHKLHVQYRRSIYSSRDQWAPMGLLTVQQWNSYALFIVARHWEKQTVRYIYSIDYSHNIAISWSKLILHTPYVLLTLDNVVAMCLPETLVSTISDSALDVLIFGLTVQWTCTPQLDRCPQRPTLLL